MIFWFLFLVDVAVVCSLQCEHWCLLSVIKTNWGVTTGNNLSYQVGRVTRGLRNINPLDRKRSPNTSVNLNTLRLFRPFSRLHKPLLLLIWILQVFQSTQLYILKSLLLNPLQITLNVVESSNNRWLSIRMRVIKHFCLITFGQYLQVVVLGDWGEDSNWLKCLVKGLDVLTAGFSSLLCSLGKASGFDLFGLGWSFFATDV